MNNDVLSERALAAVARSKGTVPMGAGPATGRRQSGPGAAEEVVPEGAGLPDELLAVFRIGSGGLRILGLEVRHPGKVEVQLPSGILARLKGSPGLKGAKGTSERMASFEAWFRDGCGAVFEPCRSWTPTRIGQTFLYPVEVNISLAELLGGWSSRRHPRKIVGAQWVRIQSSDPVGVHSKEMKLVAEWGRGVGILPTEPSEAYSEEGAGEGGHRPAAQRPVTALSETSEMRPAVEVVAFPRAFGAVLEVILAAKVSVDLTVYGVDHPRVLEALEGAYAKGVKIRLLFDLLVAKQGSPKWELEFLKRLEALSGGPGSMELRSFAASRRRMGLKGSGFPPQLHAKSGIADASVSWVGSLNLTQNSETFYEMVTVVRDPNAVRQQVVIFDQWWELGEAADLGAIEAHRVSAKSGSVKALVDAP